jgi:hypothetical protein
MDDAGIAGEWAEELSCALERSIDDIRENGLSARDFPGEYDLCIDFADGSRVEFKYAFYVVREASRQIAVFTEHCGYHLFPAHGVTITHVTRNWKYSHDS